MTFGTLNKTLIMRCVNVLICLTSDEVFLVCRSFHFESITSLLDGAVNGHHVVVIGVSAVGIVTLPNIDSNSQSAHRV
jgi:hypothetical protein